MKPLKVPWGLFDLFSNFFLLIFIPLYPLLPLPPFLPPAITTLLSISMSPSRVLCFKSTDDSYYNVSNYYMDLDMHKVKLLLKNTMSGRQSGKSLAPAHFTQP